MASELGWENGTRSQSTIEFTIEVDPEGDVLGFYAKDSQGQLLEHCVKSDRPTKRMTRGWHVTHSQYLLMRDMAQFIIKGDYEPGMTI